MARFIGKQLPAHDWPGNVRELEQCVRSVLVHGSYVPPARRAGGGEDLLAALSQGELSADELMRRYCTLVYARTGSYEEAARRLGIDRRTVKAKLDASLLSELSDPHAGRARDSGRRS